MEDKSNAKYSSEEIKAVIDGYYEARRQNAKIILKGTIKWVLIVVFWLILAFAFIIFIAVR